ncbi:uncharacterized protein KD926_007403 [Aspergillus affinis]|uniref:uncharacterized protein n=1 Tax=Aspergillus affinis TaxID=1070780 RepID=UPI0022FDC6C3|nr:uncharacterized protein KD926_007403 [Aspergillus affinis]KAI9041133.1 hypothetical protein KD926_007403 [Aspergillus affinis]
MPITLDDINFYRRPLPAKPRSSASPTFGWKPYQPPAPNPPPSLSPPLPRPPLDPPGLSGVATYHLESHNESTLTRLANTQVIPPTPSVPCGSDYRSPPVDAPYNSLRPGDSWTGNDWCNRTGAGDSGGGAALHQDQLENLQDAATTTQSVQTDKLHAHETETERPYERGRAHASCPSRQPTSSDRNPKVPSRPSRSLRSRTNPKSSRIERLPSVSVVIPVHPLGRLTTTTTQSHITRRRRRLQGTDDRSDDHDSAVHELCQGRPATTSRSNNEVEQNLPKKYKTTRPKKTTGAKSNWIEDAVGGCFGRGVFRIQPYGPRYAYFMAFLPDTVRHPSKPSSELLLEKPLRSDSRGPREQSRPRLVVGKTSHKRVPFSPAETRLLVELRSQRKMPYRDIAVRFKTGARHLFRFITIRNVVELWIIFETSHETGGAA